MNRIPVFLSFDYHTDAPTKDRLVKEWNRPDCPVDIRDVSLPGPVTDARWQTIAAQGIGRAKAVLVICGRNTHSADGVKIEVQMAKQASKPVLFLRALKEGASLPAEVAKSTPMIDLDWPSLVAALAPYANR